MSQTAYPSEVRWVASSARRPSLSVPASCGALLIALSAVACGSSGNGATVENSATPDVSFEPVGRILSRATPCTSAHTLCMSMQIPDDLSAVPESIQFLIYDSPALPAHPPNGHAGIFPFPDVVPGKVINVELSDAGLTGDYWVWTTIYMPGGGIWHLPVVDVDYIEVSPPSELALDGSPLNIDQPVIMAKLSGG